MSEGGLGERQEQSIMNKSMGRKVGLSRLESSRGRRQTAI